MGSPPGPVAGGAPRVWRASPHIAYVTPSRLATRTASSTNSPSACACHLDVSLPPLHTCHGRTGGGGGGKKPYLMLLKPATETCGSLLAPFCSLFAPLSPSPELLFSLFFFCFCSLLKNRALEPVFLRSTIY